MFDGEGDVFDDYCGVGFVYCVDSWEGVFVDVLELVVDCWVFVEVDLFF